VPPLELWRLEAHLRTMEHLTHPGALELILEPWMHILEQWRLILEQWMLEVHPRAM